MKNICLSVVFFLCVNWSFADRTNYKIYTNLMANNFCFRRLNATHQIGCSSSMSGNVGIVYVVDTLEDLKLVTQSGPDAPYVAALSERFFNFGNLTELKESGRVAGVLVLQGEEEEPISDNRFSPDDACPNRNFGLYTEKDNPEYASCKKGGWNPDNPALGMAFEDWGMPVFLITNRSDVENIRENCFVKFNKPIHNGTLRPWPLCACQLSSAMHAAKDSPTCMRRSSMFTSLTHTAPTKLCDPLSSKNIVTTLFPTNASEALVNRSLIVVAARLDSFSMFDNIAPGGDSSITGLVTLLAVANTLTDVKESMSQKNSVGMKNVLFAIFNGEAFGYIGSSRAVFDMERDIFPLPFDASYSQPAQISLKHISHFIEVAQVGTSSEFWIHSDPVSTRNYQVKEEVKKMIEKVQHYGKDKVNATSFDYPLPPASFQNFLRHDLNIPGIVITSFNEKFTNKYYNSRFDTLHSLGSRSILAKHLASISRIISSTVYNLATNKEPPRLKDKEHLIDQMLECYLENSSCQLFHEIAPNRKTGVVTKSDPLPTYVSVLSQGHPNYITVYTRHLTAYLTGEHLTGYTVDNCTGDENDKIFSYIFMAGNDSEVCVKSTVMYTLAESPASELNDWTTSEYSTWTESVWQMSSVTIFLHPSRAHEGIVLGVGIFVVVLSSLLVYYMNKRASILFGVRGLIGC